MQQHASHYKSKSPTVRDAQRHWPLSGTREGRARVWEKVGWLESQKQCAVADLT